VIFYSQICENGVYQQRLAACLIENESKKYRYLPKVASGIGWWGIFQDEKKEITQAITDPIKIKSILDLLNIKPFLPKETGSSIIIPNLRPDIQQRKDLVSDIALSVKRWYCIRLNHKSYPYGKTLTVNITDKDQPKIDVKNDRSIFEIIQKLYMQTQIKPQSQIDADTTICPISINDTFITPECGYLISKKFDLQSLRMMISNSNDASAFSLLLGEDIDNTPYPILIGYLRSPGMILSWNDSDWSKDLPKTDEITIALFIPHHEHEFKEETKAKLKEKDFNLKTFEQYLRSTEKANHIKWLDHSGFNIIKRVKDHVVKSLRATYGNQSQINPQKIYTNLTLQRRLATLLMPDDWGKDPTVVNPKPPIGGGRSGPSYKKEKFEIINIVYQATQLILDWKIHDLRKKKIVFKLKVQTENKTQDLTDLKLHQQNSISFSKQFTIDYLNQNEYLISFKEIVNSKIISEIEITLINKIQNIEGQLIILKNHDYLLPTIEVTYGD
jgi:hypothetical protein